MSYGNLFYQVFLLVDLFVQSNNSMFEKLSGITIGEYFADKVQRESWELTSYFNHFDLINNDNYNEVICFK